MVGPGRLELPTPRLSSVCSNQLSYGPIRPLFVQRTAAELKKVGWNNTNDRQMPQDTQTTKAWSLSFEERET